MNTIAPHIAGRGNLLIEGQCCFLLLVGLLFFALLYMCLQQKGKRAALPRDVSDNLDLDQEW